MVRKSKALRILFSTFFALLLILTLVGCGAKESDQSLDDGNRTILPLDEGDIAAPVFQLDPLEVSPAQAATGQEVTISSTVRNVGSTDGVFTAELVINEHAVETRDVTVAAGGSQALAFAVSRTDPGIYDVSMGDRSASFAVIAPNTAPAFEVDPLVVSPSDALSGEEISITATIRNVGDAAGVYPAVLIINGHTVETKDVGVPSGGSVSLAFTVSETEGGVYDVSIGDRSGSFSITVPTIAPVFQLDPLVITPAEAYYGDEITISTTVRNVGNSTGVYTAELLINQHAVETRDVTVASGGSQLLTFAVSETEPGVYDVALGERSGSFTVSHPPLSLQLDYIGVKCTDPKGTSEQGNIRLVVYIADGRLANGEPIWIPLEADDAIPMKDYGTKQLGHVFHTGSVGDYFKITVIALRENAKPVSSDFLTKLGVMFGTLLNPAVGGAIGGAVGGFLDEMAESNSQYTQYTYVGSYQATWTADQGWGVGRYEGVGEDNLRLWFRIWSTSEQPEVAPPILLPDVSIQDVTVPSLVVAGSTYSYNVVLANNEAYPVTVTLVENSSVQGEVWRGLVTVGAHQSKPVLRSSVNFKLAGVSTMTYTVLKRDGHPVCTVTKTVEARNRFAGWHVGGNAVTTATEGDNVTARINMFNLSPGQYTMQIRRDQDWLGSDLLVKEVTFYYDGVPGSIDLSFVPQYATGESSTLGYLVELWKGGSLLWANANAYPPRLRVGPFLIY